MKELLPLVDICIANDEDAPAGLGMTCVSGSLAHGIEERDTYVEMARQICAEYGCKKVASVVRNISCVERSIWMGMLYDAESGEHWFSLLTMCTCLRVLPPATLSTPAWSTPSSTTSIRRLPSTTRLRLRSSSSPSRATPTW